MDPKQQMNQQQQPPAQQPPAPDHKGARGGHVQQDWTQGSGTVDVKSLSDDDQKFLYKAYVVSGNPDIYPGVLKGLRNDILVLLNASQNNTPEWTNYPYHSYQGQLRAPVDAWMAVPGNNRHPNRQWP